jgi:hypothetical protein
MFRSSSGVKSLRIGAGTLNLYDMIEHPATTETLLRAYLGAEYRWEFDGQWRHLRIGEIEPMVEAAFPRATRFGLLSAWNPRSVERPIAENQVADDALQFWLANGGFTYRPAFSSARDRTWREPSWLVMGLAVQAFDDLARRFGQLGTLWWQRGERIHLRMYAQKPPGCDDACVDWVK